MIDFLVENRSNIVIGLIVLAGVILAAVKIYKNKRNGCCCGDCSNCSECPTENRPAENDKNK